MCIEFTDDGDIDFTDIWVRPIDKLQPCYFYFAMLQRVLHAIGLVNYQSLIRNSVFYRAVEDAGGAITPTFLDRKLLFFLYKHLKYGDDEIAVRKAYDTYWHSLDVPNVKTEGAHGEAVNFISKECSPENSEELGLAKRLSNLVEIGTRDESDLIGADEKLRQESRIELKLINDEQKRRKRAREYLKEKARGGS